MEGRTEKTHRLVPIWTLSGRRRRRIGKFGRHDDGGRCLLGNCQFRGFNGVVTAVHRHPHVLMPFLAPRDVCLPNFINKQQQPPFAATAKVERNP